MRNNTVVRSWATWALSSVLVVASLGLLAGCNNDAPAPATTGTTGSTSNPDEKPLKIGIVFDRGGLGDKSFNDSAWRGIQRAEKELGITSQKVESKEEKDYEANLTAFADEGLDLVIAVGLNQEKALQKVAANYPDIKFAIVDGTVNAPNVRMLKFKEEEGSFLVGFLAGKMTKTGKVGFVGGMELDLIKKFQYGYTAGVKTANPNAEVLPAKYIGNWDNIDQAKVASNVLFDGGADIIYHAAGRAGLGVIRAAKEHNLFAIGVDSDQDGEAEGNVLTSMIKRVDEAVFATISDLKAGNFASGEKWYDLAQNGVGISDLTFTKDKIDPKFLTELDEIKKKIVSGDIQVPATEAEYNSLKK